jgi:excisionase family DNA binding protein
MTAPTTWTPAAQAAFKRIEGRLFATTVETGAILRYDHRTVRKACEDGDIPAIKVGTTWRIPTAWLRQMAAIGTGQEADSPAAAAS